MAEEQALNDAREAISQILRFLGITRIVCVDDEYKDSPGVDDAVAAAAQLTPEEIRAALPETGETSLDDSEVRAERVRQTLDALDTKAKQERSEKLLAVARLKNGDVTDDKADALILKQLIPHSQLIPLTPKKWLEQGEALLAQDSEQRTLFLFDQDLSEDGGERTGGMKIISAVLASDSQGTRICGLLTHTATPENEHEQWKQLSREFSVPFDRFIVVPKKWLNQDPLIFAQRLKLVALSPDFSKLKGKAAEIVQRAVVVATKEVEEISIFDLDHIVFRVAGAEGLWEPDMLFRLHSLFSRLEARRLAHQAGEMEAIAKRLRSVSHIPTDSESLPALTTWALQRRELFEPGNHLNGNHVPLELGDIFVKTGSTSNKAYILLSQPCDLMVRPGGERQPEIDFLTLAEVVTATETPRYAEELEYFGQGPAERYFVKLKQVHQVRACMLDLCVFNSDGKASIEVGKDCPDGIRPCWTERHGRLMSVYQKKVDRLKLLWATPADAEDVRRAKDEIRRAVLADLLDVGLFKGDVSEAHGRRAVAFNCCRIGRLSRERAFGLLMAYTSCLCRPAYDRDFGKPIAKPIKP